MNEAYYYNSFMTDNNDHRQKTHSHNHHHSEPSMHILAEYNQHPPPGHNHYHYYNYYPDYETHEVVHHHPHYHKHPHPHLEITGHYEQYPRPFGHHKPNLNVLTVHPSDVIVHPGHHDYHFQPGSDIQQDLDRMEASGAAQMNPFDYSHDNPFPSPSSPPIHSSHPMIPAAAAPPPLPHYHHLGHHIPGPAHHYGDHPGVGVVEEPLTITTTEDDGTDFIGNDGKHPTYKVIQRKPLITSPHLHHHDEQPTQSSSPLDQIGTAIMGGLNALGNLFSPLPPPDHYTSNMTAIDDAMNSVPIDYSFETHSAQKQGGKSSGSKNTSPSAAHSHPHSNAPRHTAHNNERKAQGHSRNVSHTAQKFSNETWNDLHTHPVYSHITPSVHPRQPQHTIAHPITTQGNHQQFGPPLPPGFHKPATTPTTSSGPLAGDQGHIANRIINKLHSDPDVKGVFSGFPRGYHPTVTEEGGEEYTSRGISPGLDNDQRFEINDRIFKERRQGSDFQNPSRKINFRESDPTDKDIKIPGYPPSEPLKHNDLDQGFYNYKNRLNRYLNLRDSKNVLNPKVRGARERLADEIHRIFDPLGKVLGDGAEKVGEDITKGADTFVKDPVKTTENYFQGRVKNWDDMVRSGMEDTWSKLGGPKPKVGGGPSDSAQGGNDDFFFGGEGAVPAAYAKANLAYSFHGGHHHGGKKKRKHHHNMMGGGEEGGAEAGLAYNDSSILNKNNEYINYMNDIVGQIKQNSYLFMDAGLLGIGALLLLPHVGIRAIPPSFNKLAWTASIGSLAVGILGHMANPSGRAFVGREGGGHGGGEHFEHGRIGGEHFGRGGFGWGRGLRGWRGYGWGGYYPYAYPPYDPYGLPPPPAYPYPYYGGYPGWGGWYGGRPGWGGWYGGRFGYGRGFGRGFGGHEGHFGGHEGHFGGHEGGFGGHEGGHEGGEGGHAGGGGGHSHAHNARSFFAPAIFPERSYFNHKKSFDNYEEGVKKQELLNPSDVILPREIDTSHYILGSRPAIIDRNLVPSPIISDVY